jgi:thiamine kinase
LKPEKFLENWQTWSCELSSRPVVVTELTGGRTNRSFLLEADGHKLVMRLNSPVKRVPGVDRASEIRIWDAASRAGLAPKVLHADKQTGVLITEFLDGSSWGKPDVDVKLTNRLIGVLEAVHNLTVDAPLIDYAVHIEKFWRHIESRPCRPDVLLVQQRQPMQALVRILQKTPGRIGLCHHDPAPANVIDSEDRLYLLDWEYATRGPVIMDFAALCVEWNIDAAEISERVDLDSELLDSAQKIYRYICSLWAESQI